MVTAINVEDDHEDDHDDDHEDDDDHDDDYEDDDHEDDHEYLRLWTLSRTHNLWCGGEHLNLVKKMMMIDYIDD